MADRLGVLTFHRCINYGSYWQARCLVDGLRARGFDAVLLDHHSRRIDRAEWNCALRPVLPTPVPRSDYPLYRSKVREFFRAFASLPLSPSFSLDDPAAMEEFDVVVVGSDEVWNLSHPWYGGYGLFFGSGVRAGRLVSYAASFGNYGACGGLEPYWAERLGAFGFISVRDENSRALVGAALGAQPELVLDPCLQFPLPADATRGRVVRFRRPIVAVYGHNFSGWFARGVRRWAKRRGYELVSVGYRNDWADRQLIDAGPHEFARLLERAEAVVTNFFHGCVFALRNVRPFVCEPSPYRSTKIRDLLATLGAERHLVCEQTPAAGFESCLDEPVRPEILDRIRSLRRSADAYLELALA